MANPNPSAGRCQPVGGQFSTRLPGVARLGLISRLLGSYPADPAFYRLDDQSLQLHGWYGRLRGRHGGDRLFDTGMAGTSRYWIRFRLPNGGGGQRRLPRPQFSAGQDFFGRYRLDRAWVSGGDVQPVGQQIRPVSVLGGDPGVFTLHRGCHRDPAAPLAPP